MGEIKENNNISEFNIKGWLENSEAQEMAGNLIYNSVVKNTELLNNEELLGHIRGFVAGVNLKDFDESDNENEICYSAKVDSLEELGRGVDWEVKRFGSDNEGASRGSGDHNYPKLVVGKRSDGKFAYSIHSFDDNRAIIESGVVDSIRKAKEEAMDWYDSRQLGAEGIPDTLDEYRGKKISEMTDEEFAQYAKTWHL